MRALPSRAGFKGSWPIYVVKMSLILYIRLHGGKKYHVKAIEEGKGLARCEKKSQRKLIKEAALSL